MKMPARMRWLGTCSGEGRGEPWGHAHPLSAPAAPAPCLKQAGTTLPPPLVCFILAGALHAAPLLPAARPPRRQAVAQLIRAEKWADAVSMLLRFAASCDGAGARNSQCKAYLGAVVVWLYAGKANDAWVTYQVGGALLLVLLVLLAAGLHAPGPSARHASTEHGTPAWGQTPASPVRMLTLTAAHQPGPAVTQDALAVDAFTSSDEAFAADALFDAYRRCGPGAARGVARGVARGRTQQQQGQHAPLAAPLNVPGRAPLSSAYRWAACPAPAAGTPRPSRAR